MGGYYQFSHKITILSDVWCKSGEIFYLPDELPSMPYRGCCGNVLIVISPVTFTHDLVWLAGSLVGIMRRPSAISFSGQISPKPRIVAKRGKFM
jgi:hypothetical protein